MTEPNRRRRLPLVGALVAVLAVTGLDVAAEGQSAAAPPSLLPAGETYTVTLLTGDVVTVTAAAEGCPAVSVRPAEPSGVLNRSCGPDGHVRVVPGTVASLIDRTLDPALFDVTALILDGYDDARSKDLPLIVQTGGEARAAAAPMVAGLAGVRDLPSIGAVAGRHAKGADFLGSVSTRSARSAATPKVWLDRKVRTTAAPKLDHNLRQIAAPRAWNAGYTGEGTRVAVLDTGVDATHPDLVGKVAESMDFTVDGGDAGDRYGHGTHVAATIAGTGAAANGARKGVAPDAQLLNGKVLSDDGEGTDSMVIAGMEWAASRADVVNMSLGGWDPSDGTDPLSVALDTLSDQTGALFVVAAGNSGPLDGTVSSPGAASTALTVGAVNGDDVVADFSSRGPLVNTRAAKPEIVAPGVDIVAARAAGTTMGRAIDEHYTAADGTSMATPHVAGAAAVLAQRHPDWQAGQLKAALVGAADPIDDGDAYTNGAGRLDVAGALSSALSGVVSTQAVVALTESEAKLGWHNTGTRATTVALDVTVTDHHGNAVAGASLADRRLRLDAGAEGWSKLTVDRGALQPGLYTATVTARVGRDVTRTPVTFFVEPPSFDLTVATTPIPGTPAGVTGYATVWVINIDDPAIYYQGESGDAGATLTFRVPAGRYAVMGSFMSWSDGDSRMAMAGDPDVAIEADTAMTLDLSPAKPLAASVDGVATEANSLGLTYIQMPKRGVGWTDFAFAWGDAAKAGNVFLAPNDGTEIGTFEAYGAFGLDAPGSDMSPYLYDLLHPFGNGIPADPTYRVTAAEQATLARIDQKFHRLDLAESVTGHKRYGFSDEGVFLAENSTDQLSGDRVDYVSSEFAWLDEAFWNGIVTQEATARYEPGSRQEKVWVRQPLRSDWYDDPDLSLSSCQPAAPARTSGNVHIEMVTLVDEHQRFDCLADAWDVDLTRTLGLERDGQPVGEVDGSIGDFTVPREAADYRLTYDVDTSRSLTVSTRVTTAWTFRSAGPQGDGERSVAAAVGGLRAAVGRARIIRPPGWRRSRSGRPTVSGRRPSRRSACRCRSTRAPRGRTCRCRVWTVRSRPSCRSGRRSRCG